MAARRRCLRDCRAHHRKPSGAAAEEGHARADPRCGRSVEEVQAAVELIRTLDPRPGQRYNQSETRLIEPDVAFVKRDDEYVVLMNEEDMPTLRLSHATARCCARRATEKDVQRVCEGALQVRDPTAAQHRAEEEHDRADLRGDCAPPAGLPGARRAGPEADDDQGGRRGDRRASFHRQPRGGQQVCAYLAGRL